LENVAGRSELLQMFTVLSVITERKLNELPGQENSKLCADIALRDE
jgi:hypothetical protein